MILTVFRSRLMPGVEDEYGPLAKRLSELAAAMPGHISHKRFDAVDGERVTIIEFTSEEAQRAWAEHAEHIEAQRAGRERIYAEFDLKICEVKRSTAFKCGG